jgi:hypothetical protein
MKKIITLSLVGLFAISSMAQKGKDKLAQEFRAIKSELNLSEKQEIAIKKLFSERKNTLKPQSEFIMSEEEKKQQKIEQIKARKKANHDFKMELNSILNEEQQAKLKELMPPKNKMELKEKESKPGHDHNHKVGEEHSH